MTSVLHVIDADFDETKCQDLGALQSHKSSDPVTHSVCSIDGPMTRRIAHHWGKDLMRAEHRHVPGVTWAPRLAEAARRAEARIVHAWGIRAAAACSAQLIDLPLVTTLLDPQAARNAARWLRAFPTDAVVVAGCQVARTRLVAAGIAVERAVVIREPVDFAAVNRARSKDLRRSVVGDARPVLLLAGPPSERGGQYSGLWAAAVLKQIHKDLRVIMPYDSREARRLGRLVDGMRIPALLTVPDSRLTWAELVTCADVFVLPALGDVSTGSMAVAMAAGLPVVASAVRSVAELIAHGKNGLLCKPGDSKALAGRILTAIEDAELVRKLTDVARAQVFETCSLRAYVDNYARLYQNVLAGRAPGEDICDTAMVA